MFNSHHLRLRPDVGKQVIGNYWRLCLKKILHRNSYIPSLIQLNTIFESTMLYNIIVSLPRDDHLYPYKGTYR